MLIILENSYAEPISSFNFYIAPILEAQEFSWDTLHVILMSLRSNHPSSLEASTNNPMSMHIHW